jgi:hypothetical protein
MQHSNGVAELEKMLLNEVIHAQIRTRKHPTSFAQYSKVLTNMASTYQSGASVVYCREKSFDFFLPFPLH